MMEDTHAHTKSRIGYGIAMAVNAILMVFVNNVLVWGWFEWLTDDFELVVPYINFSLTAAIGMNVLYMVYDAKWFRALGESLLLVTSMVVTVRLFQVFPFDFSMYDVNMDSIVRMALIAAMVGIAIGLLANMIKLVGLAASGQRSSQ